MRLRQHLNESLDATVYEILKKLYAKSIPFLKEYIKAMDPHPSSLVLYSGRNKTSDYFEKDVRKGRWPQDTNEDIHRYFDEEMYHRFGIRGRSNSIFATGSYDMAHRYGFDTYSIWPQGKYKYLWSPKISDLYMDIDSKTLPDIRLDSWIDNYINDQDIHDMATDKLTDEFERFVDPSKFKSPEAMKNAMTKYINDNIFDTKVKIVTPDAQKQVDEEKARLGKVLDSYQTKDLRRAIRSGNEIMVSSKSYMAIGERYMPYVLKYMQLHGIKKPTKELVGAIKRDFPVSAFIELV